MKLFPSTLALSLLLTLAACSTTPAPATTTALQPQTVEQQQPQDTKPVLIVHGYDVDADGSNPCEWQEFYREMTDPEGPNQRTLVWLRTQQLDPVASPCIAVLDTHAHPAAEPARHTKHFGATLPGYDTPPAHVGTGHTVNTTINHLAYHVAWSIWDRYSSRGQAVDVLGHSMGGLILRYALWRTAHNDPDFPPHLLIDDVVTVATPHHGARAVVQACGTKQCEQMRNGSAFLNSLNARGWGAINLGEMGGDWSLYGFWTNGTHSDDDTVGMTSALALEDERYGGFPAHLKKVYDVEGKTYGWGSGDICDGIGNCHTYPFFARIGHRPSNLYFLNNPAVVGRRTDLAFRDGAVSWTLWQSLAYSLNRKGS